MHKVVVAVVFFLSASIFSQQNIYQKNFPFTGKVTGEKVRIRAFPSFDGKIIEELKKNTLLLIMSEKDNFYAVKPSEKKRVYVYRNYILDNMVEATKVNVRLNPNLEAPILGQLIHKQQVKGKICENNNKWFEIEIPENIFFYISKEYVTKIGEKECYSFTKKRKKEVKKLLNSALSLTQKELKKPFHKIDIKKPISQFEAIIKEYTDFEEYEKQAKKALSLLKEKYLQKKIFYLESREKLSSLEKEKILQEIKGTSSSKKSLKNKEFLEKKLTENQKPWLNLEKELFNSWLIYNPEKKAKDFYQEQQANAIELTGIIESYNKNIKNKPGNFILKGKNIPKAYLYSINVDLEKYIGKKVTILASPRPNNNFAFPSYFVNKIN